MIRRPSSLLYVRSQCSNVVYKSTWSFIVKLHIEHPLKGGTKFVLNGQGLMTKMAAISIYGANLYIASSQELRVYNLKIGMHHWGLKVYKAGINDDLWLTLTYFTAWLKLVTREFEWENCYKVHVIKWENCE